MPKKLSRLLIPALLVLWTILMLLPVACQAAQPDLIITGTGLYEDVVIYSGDWSKYELVERYYSSNNNWNYHKIWKAKGYDLFDLIGIKNIIAGKDHEVAFISSLDGGRVTRTIKELQSLCYHPKFVKKGREPVGPMLSFYRTAVFEPDYQEIPDPAEVVWTDKSLTEDDRDLEAPRLMMGQRADQCSDNNQSFFNKQVGRIVVGDERPSTKDETAKKGGGGAGKPEATKGSGTTKSGKAGEKKADGKSEMENEEGAAAPKDKDDRGDKKNKEDADGAEIAAPETGDGKNPGISGTAAGGETRRRWPWIAAGAVVAAGLAGGGVYYYINKRRISK
jgi:hypothetical protein